MNIEDHVSLGVQIVSVGVLWASFFLLISGCASLPIFPFPDATIIETQKDWERIKNPSLDSQNQTFQLAGRIIRAEVTEEGVSFLANWLPFPTNAFDGPSTRSIGSPNRPFFMHFSGPVDHDGRRQGNEFLLLGQLVGMQDTTTFHGFTKSFPLFTVQCLHVWKTAGTDLQEFIWMDPGDDRYPPPLEESYCLHKTPT